MFDDEITAVILAGGFGTRLRSVVSDRPKVLAKIGNRPFILFLLEQIKKVNVRNVVLCIGYQGDKIRAELGSSYGDVWLKYSEETIPLGTAGALRLAMPLFQSKTLLVMNGDSYCDIDLKDFFEWHCVKKAQASLVIAKENDVRGLGFVQTNEGGAVTHFQEKIAVSKPGCVNAGVYLINSSLIRTIPENVEVSLEYTVLPTWIGQGLFGYQFTGKRLDIGIPENYAKAERFFDLKVPPK